MCSAIFYFLLLLLLLFKHIVADVLLLLTSTLYFMQKYNKFGHVAPLYDIIISVNLAVNVYHII